MPWSFDKYILLFFVFDCISLCFDNKCFLNWTPVSSKKMFLFIDVSLSIIAWARVLCASYFLLRGTIYWHDESWFDDFFLTNETKEGRLTCFIWRVLFFWRMRQSRVQTDCWHCWCVHTELSRGTRWRKFWQRTILTGM